MNRNHPAPPLPKVYVPVKADFDADGNIRPYEITWEDGTHYQIDRVLDVRQAAAMRSGGQGDRYTVVIGGQRSTSTLNAAPTSAAETSAAGSWKGNKNAQKLI